MLDFTRVRAVLIDIDDTVLDFDKCAAYSIKKAEEDSGITLPEDTFDYFKPINKQLWLRLQAGEYDLAHLRRIRWDTIFAEMGVRADGPLFERYFETALAESAEQVEGAGEALRVLSARFPVYAASNSPAGQQENRLRLAGLDGCFSGVFVSGDLGFSKPDPRFFDKLFEKLPAYRREETVMIGDSLSADIAGAKAAGVPTVWLDRHADAKGDEANLTVRSLRELTDIIRQV